MDVYQSFVHSIETIEFLLFFWIVLNLVAHVFVYMKVQNHNFSLLEEKRDFFGLSKLSVLSILFGTMSLILLLLLLSLSTFSVYATSVDSVYVQDKIEGVTVRETMYISLINNTLSEIVFGLPVDVTDITLEGKSVASQNGTVNIPLSCTSCNITISFTLKGAVTQESSDTRVYSRTMNVPGQPRLLNYDVYLPTGAYVRSTMQNPAIVPVQTAISTDGENIVLHWSRTNPQLPEQYVIRYLSSEPISGGAITLLTELTEWPVWILLILLFGIGIVLGALIQRHLREPLSQSLPFVPASLLSSDELIIIRALRQNPLDQKELGKQLNWSKSKVSAIMTGLERKGIIKREKLGRKFKAELIKAVEE